MFAFFAFIFFALAAWSTRRSKMIDEQGILKQEKPPAQGMQGAQVTNIKFIVKF